MVREAVAWQSRFWWPDVTRVIRKIVGRFLPGMVEKDPVVTPTITQTELTDWLVGNLNVSNDSRSLTILVSFSRKALGAGSTDRQ